MKNNPPFNLTPHIVTAGALLLFSCALANATQNITVSPGVSSATLQSDVNSISAAGGGTLTFNAGTYNVTSALELKSNVKLHGVGQSTVTIKAPSSAYGWAMIEINGNGISSCVVEQMTIDGNIGSYYGDHNNSTYDNALGFHGFASNFQGFGPLNINNCTFHNCGEGIGIGDGNNLTIDRVTIHDCGVLLANGLYNHDAYLNSCANVEVKNCTYYNSWHGTGLHFGSGGSTGFNFNVHDNNISNNGSCGINCQNSGSGLTFSYNTCSSNGKGSNIATPSSGGDGLAATGSGTIAHNTTQNNTKGFGIHTLSGTWTVNYNTSNGNYYNYLGLWGTITKCCNTGDQ
jgi:parallel beta helix pectate lyase-like protein